MTLVELDGFPSLKAFVVCQPRRDKIDIKCRALFICEEVGIRAHLKVDFTSSMRALSNPSVVPAYFYIYGCPGEGNGLANILVLLRLLFSCL